ncbi:phage tail protein [Psychrobacillus psychrodurans]|uniref:phage tail protein n=1 Tax=Psychrobacillus psychrodurans TaxID=126157 RepID=UPI003D0624F7
MLTVTKDNQTEMLNQIQGFEMDEEVNGSLVVKFTSFSVENNPGYELAKEESITSVEGYDFRVKQLKEVRNRKDITAMSTFYDLVGVRQEDIYGGTRTFNQFAAFVFTNTGWTFSSTDVSGSKFIANFGNDNVIKLVQALCAAYECEYKIMPNKHIVFSKQIGGDYDAQYRFGHNVQALSKSVDTTNLRTRITGYGGNGLKVTYTSPNHTTFGIIDAEPIYDDRYTTSESMLEHLKRNLIDYPEATFELDSVELTDKELGERVWLIYEPMGIEFQTRVLSKKSVIRGKRLATKLVVLGNTMPRTLGDILTSQKIEIDENAKEYRSRIEQTNERITLEVEAVNSSIATLEIKADSINLSVTQLDGRLGNAESSINIQAGQIQSKVSYSEYNGQTVSSMITQDAYAISLMAQNLKLQGLVSITSLNNPGEVIIDSGNVYGNSFVVGRGTGSTLTVTAIAGSHVIQSIDAAGLGIISNGSMGLRASGANGVYIPTSNLVAQAGFRVTGGIADIQVPMTVQSTLNASTLQVQGMPVATQSWVANMNYIGQSTLTAQLAQLERDIVAWANGKFALK